PGVCDKPKFLEPIPNVNITAGRSVSLPCLVDHVGDNQVLWMHIDRQMLLSIDNNSVTLIPRFRVSHPDSRTWTLHIENVTPDDTGYYVCQVNMVPMINQVGFLQVVVSPEFLDSESSPSHVAMQEGGDVTLRCRAEGVPSPTITWKREDGLPFTIAARSSQGVSTYSNGIGMKENTIQSEELELRSVTRKDMGAYLCIASNRVPPSISKRIVLDVHFMPVITVPNQLFGAPAGSSITLECEVSAFPPAVQFWSFNGQMLINSSRHETQELRSEYTITMRLHLRYVSKADYGIYMCEAKNSLGQTESNLRLYG
ncbi:unnamed protein product, partial [Meganyctiphanes norvegica]